jgi:hypothetical protein
MSGFVSLSRSDNLVVRLSDAIQHVKRSASRASTSGDAQTHEDLRDLETTLCRLMADMIASPMTGRLYLPNPAGYVDTDTRQASVARQLYI